MVASELRPHELSSWKEIACYLGVGVRTAQMWERDRGLPVRRLPGGRGRVSITAAELEAWKRSASLDPAPTLVPMVLPTVETVPAVAAFRPRWRRWLPVLVGVTVLVALGAGLAASWLHRAWVPAGYRVEQHSFIVTDARGRELWRTTIDTLGPVPERSVWFGDLDGDGLTEVLVVPVLGRREVSTPLICYSHDGVERWRFIPGRTVHTRTETFAPPFGVTAFAVARVGKQKALRVVVTSLHYLYYPSQVALLAADGSLLREYWHSGGLPYLVVADDRMVLAGVHNATKSATLLALDPDTMSGTSVEENPDYQLEGFRPGVEVARLLFPRSCMNQILEPFAYVGALWREPTDWTIEVRHRMSPTTGASVYYHLNADLTLKSMTVGSNFEKAHDELAATHVLNHALSVAEIAALRNIRYLPVRATSSAPE